MQNGRRLNETDLCLLYTSDAADEEDSVELGGRRIIIKIDSFVLHEPSRCNVINASNACLFF